MQGTRGTLGTWARHATILAGKLALSLVSFLVCAMILELSLRLFYPEKYVYAAESYFVRDDYRIWSRSPNSRSERPHPDSLVPHEVFHNSHALRQHREFSEAALLGSVNVGFFGDSFTENLRVPAPYAFTEPLDYLLNASGAAFNVLNFGVDGYGTDQAYTYYLHSTLSPHLQHVFYVFCSNDIRNIFENQLYRVDPSGTLRHEPALATPWWVRVVSRLHVTYLTIDLYHRLAAFEWQSFNFLEADRDRTEAREGRTNSPGATAVEEGFVKLRDATPTNDGLADAVSALGNADLDRTLVIFRTLLREWKREVEDRGGRFYIVSLPNERPPRPLFEGYTVIDLAGLFEHGEWRFEADGHWNETGNARAAVHLYRFLESEMALPRLTDDEFKTRLGTYYTAFRDDWMPRAWTTPSAASAEDLARIRQKYTAIEHAATGS